jgi:hypothetical protein
LAAHPEQRNRAAPKTRQQRAARQERQSDALRQVARLGVARGAAVAEVVDQEPELRAWVRHRSALESKDEVKSRAGDSEAQRVEPQGRPPRELQLRPPEQKPAFSAQPAALSPLLGELPEKPRKGVEQRQLAQLPVLIQREPALGSEKRSQPAQVRPELPPRAQVRRVPPQASSAQLSPQHPSRLCQP